MCASTAAARRLLVSVSILLVARTVDVHVVSRATRVLMHCIIAWTRRRGRRVEVAMEETELRQHEARIIAARDYYICDVLWGTGISPLLMRSSKRSLVSSRKCQLVLESMALLRKLATSGIASSIAAASHSWPIGFLTQSPATELSKDA